MVYTKQGTQVKNDGIVGVYFVRCVSLNEALSTHRLLRVEKVKKQRWRNRPGLIPGYYN